MTEEQAIQTEIAELEKDIQEKKKYLSHLKHLLPEEKINDYTLKDGRGNPVALSELFDDRNELLVVHNMGKRCTYCTLWADGFNGLVPHLENRAPFIVITPDEPAVQRDFAESRGWRFRMYSCDGSDFARDLNFQDEKGSYWPGVSTFFRDADGTIYRSTYRFFGPGDDFCSAWHLFDLLPNGVNSWQPRYTY